MEIFAISVVMTVLALGGVFGVVVGRQRRIVREDHTHCRCPACGQKMRYLLSKAGKPAQCPRCPERFLLPADQEAMTNDKPTVMLNRTKRVGSRV